MDVKYEFEVRGGVFDHMVSPGKLRVFADDTVLITGVDFGPKLSLHHTELNYWVVKAAGHMWYLNQYQRQQYTPASFLVFRREAPRELTFLFQFDARKEVQSGSASEPAASGQDTEVG